MKNRAAIIALSMLLQSNNSLAAPKCDSERLARRSQTIELKSGDKLSYRNFRPKPSVKKPLAPVLLLHGLLTHGEPLTAMAIALAKEGHPVFVPDLLGHGK